MSKYTKSQVIDYMWQYSRYYGNQIAFLSDIEENGSASLIYLFCMLENILKSHTDDFNDTFKNAAKISFEHGLLSQVEYEFLNNKKTGVRKLRNIFSHANLSKFNLQFANDPILYPLTENDSCQLLYQKISDIIFNLMLKVSSPELTVEICICTDNDIKDLNFKIIEFSPEEILIDKGIEPTSLKGWDELPESAKYRQAENAQNVNMLNHILSNIKSTK